MYEEVVKEKQNEKLNPKEWINLYADFLYNYAFYRVNDQVTAEDLVQDTFLSALKGQTGFKGGSSEKTWLVSILKRKIIDHYRKKSTQSIQESLDSRQIASKTDYYFEGDEGRSGHWNEAHAPKEWTTDLNATIEQKEFYTILQKCMALLPGKWAAVFSLKTIEEQSTEEVCKELDITPSNYWIIMHRAKLQLRECMGKNWFNER